LGKGYTLPINTLALERDTSCTSILFAVKNVHTTGGVKGYTLHVQTAGVGGGERDTPACPSILLVLVELKVNTQFVKRWLLLVLFLLCDVETHK
jgi:hypothetical protein